MTWEHYWAPLLIDRTLGAAIAAFVAWLFRRWVLKALDDRVDAVAGHAVSADLSASLAAQDASTMRAELHKLATGEIDLDGLQQRLQAANRTET